MSPVALYETPLLGPLGHPECQPNNLWELASLAGSTTALKEEKEEQGRAGHGEQLGRKEMLGWTHSQDSSLHLSSVSNDSLITGLLSWLSGLSLLTKSQNPLRAWQTAACTSRHWPEGLLAHEDCKENGGGEWAWVHHSGLDGTGCLHLREGCLFSIVPAPSERQGHLSQG